jgi:hypothetical protein
MIKITPNLEVYGTYARRSALADALEVQALRGASSSIAELADYIRDNDWTRLLSDKFTTGGPGDEEESGSLGEEVDASVSAADEISSVIEERREMLGDSYPYDFSSGRLRYRGRDDLRHSYLLFLGLAILHAYRIETDPEPWQIFEDSVAQCFSDRGFRTANLGRLRRSRSNFKDALEEVGSACGLITNFAGVTIKTSAQEEGVDVLAHWDWLDSRPLHWVYIIQATCGKSDTWNQKMNGPSVNMWKNLLGLLVLPRAVLAVPHHVPRDMVAYLYQRDGGKCLLLDRLRLCRLESEAEIVERMAVVLKTIEVDFR